MSGPDSPDKLPVLRHLALFLTESCNLACSYCFASNMERRAIDEGLARQAVDQLLRPESPADRVAITFWGGEPLLEFELMRRLVQYARERAAALGRNVRFTVPTNLTRLTPEMLKFFESHEVGLSLSLDGDESAQALRPFAGGGSSAPVIREKLRLLTERLGAREKRLGAREKRLGAREERLPGVRMTVTPQTAGDFYHHVRWFLDRGFTQIYFAPVLEADWAPQTLAALEREQQRLVTHLVEAFRAGQHARPAFHTWDKALAWRALDRRGKTQRGQRMLCGAGTSMLAVDIYGDLYPCHRYVFYDKAQRAETLGNVQQGLPDPQVLQDYGRIDRDTLGTARTRCRDCPDEGDCYAYCPAVNYALQGHRHRVDERLCHFARLEQRMVDRIEAELGGDPAFERHREQVLLRVYAPGLASAELAGMLAGLEEGAVDRLADRAAAILERVTAPRRTGDPPDEGSA